jgi:hypothetical protein
MVNVGSTAVRKPTEKYQPTLSSKVNTQIKSGRKD